MRREPAETGTSLSVSVWRLSDNDRIMINFLLFFVGESPALVTVTYLMLHSSRLGKQMHLQVTLNSLKLKQKTKLLDKNKRIV